MEKCAERHIRSKSNVKPDGIASTNSAPPPYTRNVLNRSPTNGRAYQRNVPYTLLHVLLQTASDMPQQCAHKIHTNNRYYINTYTKSRGGEHSIEFVFI